MSTCNSVTLPADLFQHRVFIEQPMMRIGVYAWLCANNPVSASHRKLAREWGLSLGATQRLLDLFIASGFLKRENGLFQIVPWEAIEISSPGVANRARCVPIEKRTADSALRMRVFQRDGFQCIYCGSYENLACDHVVPRSRGGLTVLENLATSCRSCNSKKGPLTPEEWRGVSVAISV